MIGAAHAFSSSYAQARAQFLSGAASLGLAVDSRIHPNMGADGEVLATDVVLDGDSDAQRMLVVSSACHGVEGYCGSGVQVFALADQEWRDKAKAQGVAVLYLHALNPHGFSYKRRVTQENVDLNRNFGDHTQAEPANPGYAELHPLLLPEQWPPNAQNTADQTAWIAKNGMRALQETVSRGQHDFADGLFYGGVAPTWSNQTLRAIFRQYCAKNSRIAWIDLHTGLGPEGHGERIFAGPNNPAALERARRWWGGDGATAVTSIYDGTSASAYLTGLMWSCILQECPSAEYTGIAMEYGTQDMMHVIHALRADHWVHRERLQGRTVDGALVKTVKQQVLDAFYVDTDAWKGQVISQARQAMFQAVDGLAS